MTDLEVKIIQALSNIDDDGKNELLSYCEYLKWCTTERAVDLPYLKDEKFEIFEREYSIKREIEEQVKQQKMKLVSEFSSFESIKLGKWKGIDLEWLVIDCIDNKQLLLSKYVVDKRRLDKSKTCKPWKETSLYEYLNRDFFNSVVKYGRGIKQNDLVDKGRGKIFLLNSGEFYKYLSNKNEKFGVDSMSAELDSVGYCKWMLCPSEEENKVVFVNSAGNVFDGSPNMTYGIRPAMWVVLQ